MISGLNEGVWPCKMYDSQGRIVLTTEVSNGQEFSLYGLSDGWYTLQIVGVLGSAKRVIVQR
ncbi:MAG TPA: T9SS type A sorting domain-containing protein [Flavobacteriales bacterium]|nr:T9SS type A sorting domain-containing protein [Flavobacteriales bacterium]